MFFRSRRFIIAVIFLLIAALCLILISRIPRKATSTTTLCSAPCIILDAGHGGADGGATSSSGVTESKINLEITQKLEALLLFSGHQVQMTRTDEKDLSAPEAQTIKEQKVSDLKNRAELVNSIQDATLISIHQNSLAGNGKVHGAQVFYNAVQPASKIAQSVQQSLNQVINPGNEKNCKAIDASIYLLKEVQAPAILVECGFLSNAEETRLLCNGDYQKQLAVAIAAGYLQYHTKEG